MNRFVIFPSELARTMVLSAFRQLHGLLSPLHNCNYSANDFPSMRPSGSATVNIQEFEQRHCDNSFPEFLTTSAKTTPSTIPASPTTPVMEPDVAGFMYGTTPNTAPSVMCTRKLKKPMAGKLEARVVGQSNSL